MFADARNAAGIQGKDAPTFHEVRPLGSELYADAGFEITDIQQLMAHSDPGMTRRYQDGHDLPWQKVSIQLASTTMSW